MSKGSYVQDKHENKLAAHAIHQFPFVFQRVIFTVNRSKRESNVWCALRVPCRARTLEPTCEGTLVW